MVKTFVTTPSQQETLEALKTKFSKPAHKLFGFAAEPIIGSRNMLVVRKIGEKENEATVESMCVGPRGKIQTTVKLHTKN